MLLLLLFFLFVFPSRSIDAIYRRNRFSVTTGRSSFFTKKKQKQKKKPPTNLSRRRRRVSRSERGKKKRKAPSDWSLLVPRAVECGGRRWAGLGRQRSTLFGTRSKAAGRHVGRMATSNDWQIRERERERPMAAICARVEACAAENRTIYKRLVIILRLSPVALTAVKIVVDIFLFRLSF